MRNKHETNAKQQAKLNKPQAAQHHNKKRSNTKQNQYKKIKQKHNKNKNEKMQWESTCKSKT